MSSQCTKQEMIIIIIIIITIIIIVILMIVIILILIIREIGLSGVRRPHSWSPICIKISNCTKNCDNFRFYETKTQDLVRVSCG